MSDAELPWYTDKGPFQDVVISSRIRLSRNLANFPFPANFHGDDSERVQSVVFDAFSKIDSEEENFSFSAVDARNMDEEGRNLFKEWGVIREIRASENIPPETGLVFQRKQALSLSARINFGDHLKISSFRAGMDFVCFLKFQQEVSICFRPWLLRKARKLIRLQILRRPVCTLLKSNARF